jgi:phosphoribosyl-ATP pyrophosphohydrolase
MRPDPNSADSLAALAAVIASRLPAHGGNPEASYVARLLHKARTLF